eukprot:993040-Rhodomonas_salina.1
MGMGWGDHPRGSGSRFRRSELIQARHAGHWHANTQNFSDWTLDCHEELKCTPFDRTCRLKSVAESSKPVLHSGADVSVGRKAGARTCSKDRGKPPAGRQHAERGRRRGADRSVAAALAGDEELRCQHPPRALHRVPVRKQAQVRVCHTLNMSPLHALSRFLPSFPPSSVSSLSHAASSPFSSLR